ALLPDSLGDVTEGSEGERIAIIRGVLRNLDELSANLMANASGCGQEFSVELVGVPLLTVGTRIADIGGNHNAAPSVGHLVPRRSRDQNLLQLRLRGLLAVPRERVAPGLVGPGAHRMVIWARRCRTLREVLALGVSETHQVADRALCHEVTRPQISW